MFMSKTKGQVAKSAGRRPPRKLMVAGAFVACALGAFATRTAGATDPKDSAFTNFAGPVMLDDKIGRAHV